MIECIILSENALAYLEFLAGLFLAIESLLLAVFGMIASIYCSYRLAGQQRAGIIWISKYICYFIVLLQIVTGIMACLCFYFIECNINTEIPSLISWGVRSLIAALFIPTICISLSLR